MGSGNIVDKVRQAIAGKKTYLLALAAIIGTAVTWSEGAITDIQAIVALYVALQSCFIRAGIAKAPSSQEIVDVVTDAQEDDGYNAKLHAEAREADAKVRESAAYARLLTAQAQEKEIEVRVARINAPDN